MKAIFSSGQLTCGHIGSIAMNKSVAIRACLILLACGLAGPAAAEDTDIFVPRADFEPGVPTIIFMLDNTSNWSRASVWPSGSQGQAEVKAIKGVVQNLQKPVNIGLMEFTTKTNTSNNGGPHGGYVRFAVRPMGTSAAPTAANTALQEMLTQMDVNVNSTVEKVSNTQGIFANAQYELWKYLTGGNSWAGMDVGADYDNTNVGNGANQVYPTYRVAAGLGNWAYTNTGGARNNLPAGAQYIPPPLSGCGNTYVVIIGNNRNGTSAVPAPTAGEPPVTTLQGYSYPVIRNVINSTYAGTYQATWARFLRNRPDLGASGSNAAVNGAVITYTIDAYDSSPNAVFSAMMQDVAKQGGGESYKAGTEDELLTALNTIVTKILAVNSVFASVALPVSVNQRGSYLNQVYLGVFRPDAERAPNWVGNLKQYQLKVNGSTLYLADAGSPPQPAADGNFISPTALSFWTTPSSFWSTGYYPNSQGQGGVSDAPDGDTVEKGGVAQKLRTTYATTQASRKIYTCNGACAGASALSGFPFSTSNASLSADTTLSSDATERTNIINWIRGANNRLDDNPSGTATDIRGFIHGDVVHSRPVVINYNRTDDDVYVYYGANDGLFRAVRGGQGSNGGQEAWAFVPTEGYSKLKRLRDHTPLITTTDKKPYFIDGSPTVYTYSTANDGTINSAQGDKAYLYLTARRGGRFIYALNISDPEAPSLLWKRTNADSGFSELGQTWSELKVGRIRGQTDPVVIFGLGYDPVANDTTVVPATATMGRGVMVLNAVTGAKIWSSTDVAAGANRNGTNEYAIAADVAQVDTNNDGWVDRLVAADTGGNIWRINVDYTGAPAGNTSNDPSYWTIDKLATLGTGTGAGARKFLAAPDVVVASTAGIPVPYDTILIGSGDREQPFDTTVTNRFYMLKDEHLMTHRYGTPLTEADLYDTTNNLIQQGTTAEKNAAQVSLNAADGWYITLGTGEKVDGTSTTLSGASFFGTNTPSDGNGNSCVANLGTARTYAVSYLNGGAVIHLDGNLGDSLNLDDRSLVIPGGGFPPPPVALQVDVDGKPYQGVAFGPQIFQPSGVGFGRRFREWWYQDTDN
jgi:type IV pilus assembly protein PilY1